jgi:hypothetical protein
MRRFAGLFLIVSLTGWGLAAVAGVSPSSGAQSQSGAKIKPPQQQAQEAEQASESKEDKR